MPARIADLGRLRRVLASEFGIVAVNIAEVEGGLDMHASRWRVLDELGVDYFVKVSEVPYTAYRVLNEACSGLDGAVLVPRVSLDGERCWAGEEGFWVHVFPFISRKNGLEKELTPAAVRRVGEALWQVHEYVVPVEMVSDIPFFDLREYSADGLREVCKSVRESEAQDDVIVRLREVVERFEPEVSALCERVETLGATYQKYLPLLNICHMDIHVANILSDGDQVCLIDWDTCRIAPREADLMFFVGGGIFGHEAWFEEAFWEGYGRVNYDHRLMTFFRYLRALDDVKAFIEDASTANDPGEANMHIHYLAKQFVSGSNLELARREDRSAGS